MKKKNRKIIIGSLMAVCMLMMTPMISAMQFNDIEETIKVNNIDNRQKLDYEQLKENIQDQTKDSVNDPKFHIVLKFVLILAISRYIRSTILLDFAGWYGDYGIYFDHPLLGYRGLFLSGSTSAWLIFWTELAEKSDWRWPDLFNLVVYWNK